MPFTIRGLLQNTAPKSGRHSGKSQPAVVKSAFVVSHITVKRLKTYYLKGIVLGDPLNHVRNGRLEDFFKRQGVHHGEDSGKMLQDLLLLFHPDRLTICDSNVSLPVSGNLNLSGGKDLHAIQVDGLPLALNFSKPQTFIDSYARLWITVVILKTSILPFSY